MVNLALCTGTFNMGSQSNLVRRDMVEQEEREDGGKGEQLIILFNFVKNLV